MTIATPAARTAQPDVWTFLARAFVLTFLLCLGILVIYPLLWMTLSGFKTNTQIFNAPFDLPA